MDCVPIPSTSLEIRSRRARLSLRGSQRAIRGRTLPYVQRQVNDLLNGVEPYNSHSIGDGHDHTS